MSMSNASQTRDDIEKPFINTISEALLTFFSFYYISDIALMH